MITLITTFIVDSLMGIRKPGFIPLLFWEDVLLFWISFFITVSILRECRLSAAEWYACLFYPLPMP